MIKAQRGGTSVRSFTVIVLQLFFVIAAQAASVTTDSNHYAPGSTAVVTVSGGPGNVSDWVGVYAVGATNYDYQDWRYLNGEYTPPSQGQSSANLSLMIPQSEGQYEVRFLLDDGYDTIAISQSFEVSSSPPDPVLTLDASQYAPGAVIAVTLMNGPANPTDWIGL